MTAPEIWATDVDAVHLRMLVAVALTDLIDTATVATILQDPVDQVRACLGTALERAEIRSSSPHMSPEHRQMVLDSVAPTNIEAMQARILTAWDEGLTMTPGTASWLVESGCRDVRLAELLLVEVSQAPWPARSHLIDLAEATGADRLDVAAQRAETAAALGHFEEALQHSDLVLGLPGHRATPRAVRAAAVAHAHRGMTQWAAHSFRYLGAGTPASDTALAVWALLGDGDRETSTQLFESAGPAAPTSAGRALSLLARGLRSTLDGDGSDSLPMLVQSTKIALPMRDSIILPESPSVVAALVAINLGELDIADQILAAALDADVSGSTHRARHRLLRAWVAMLRGHLEAATQLVDDVVATSPMSERDEAMTRALRVGIARRDADVGAVLEHWRIARDHLPTLSVDLYSLLILGELAVTANRLDESFRIESHLAEAIELLDRLGRPVLWSAMFHWYGLHAAFAASDPDAVIPHAEALVASSATSRVAALLASAGQTWLRVLQDDVDLEAVRHAVDALESLGLGWDAKRLAARAAASTTDRRVMLELMHLARSSHRRVVLDDSDETISHRTPRSSSQMTSREWEVAAMVIDGLTYKEIGERLFISPKTVEHHVARIRQRLGADSRQEMLSLLRALTSTDH